MTEQSSPYPTDNLVLYREVVEHPVETFQLHEVEAVDILLPYAHGIGGGPFRTLRLTLHEAGVRLTDFSHLNGNHREDSLPLNLDTTGAPFHDLALEAGTAALFGREHNPGQLPILERPFVSREHFSLAISVDGLAMTIRDHNSHNGMAIQAKHTLSSEYAYLYGATA